MGAQKSAYAVVTPRDWLVPVPKADPALAQALENDLLGRHGPMLGNDDLRVALGYPSREAFRQALTREQVPVPVFSLPRRRGKFALVKDVAAWLARCHAEAPRPRRHKVTSK